MIKLCLYTSQREDYEKELQEFVQLNGYDKVSGIVENENLIEFFMNRGINRADAQRNLS